MKIFLPLLSFLLLFSSLSAQKIATSKVRYDPFGYDNFLLLQDHEKSAIISKQKTTNLEYLCFLQWVSRVYGIDYPEVYDKMMPDTGLYPDLFNPAFAGSPVKGVTVKQAQAFCQWRSDRLNEFILIREGILKKNYNQINEDCFTTESYLAFQYAGLIKSDLLDKYTNTARSVVQSDYFLLPVFFLPSRQLIKSMDSLCRRYPIATLKKMDSDLDWCITEEIKYASFSKSNSPFHTYFRKLDKDPVAAAGRMSELHRKYQSMRGAQKIIFDSTASIPYFPDLRTYNLPFLKEKLYYYKLLTTNTKDPFANEGKNAKEKDSLGRMNFLYIADNADGSPICLKRYSLNENEYFRLENGFYFAMNLPYRIWWSLQEFDRIRYSKKLYRY